MNGKQKRNFEWLWQLALIVLLVMALCGMFYYGNRKEGYHVDELYSFGLANSEYLPFMHFGEMEYSVKDWMLEYGTGENLIDLIKNLAKDYRILSENGFHIKESEIFLAYQRAQANSADTRSTTWMSGQAYLEYLGASSTNRFNYASVYYNQRGDVHPPLFYLLLHTVSSFFPNSFSKWFGLIPNFIYMALAMILLYRLVERHLGGRGFALAVVSVFALSQYMVTTALFLRMYALLTLMVLWCFDLHLELLGNPYSFSKSLHRRLLFSALLGYLTHYYFVLYIMMAALVVVIALACCRKWKTMLLYVLTMLEAAALGLVIWPFSIRHVFLGYRGKDSLETLGSFQFSIWRLKYMFEMFADSMLGGQRWLLYGLMIVILIGLPGFYFAMRMRAAKANNKPVTNCVDQSGTEHSIEGREAAGRKRKGQNKAIWNVAVGNESVSMSKLALAVAPVAVYLITTSQIIPFLDSRYHYCLYPFMVIYMVCGIGWIARGLFMRFPKLPGYAQYVAAWTMAVLLVILGNFVTNTPGWIGEGGQERTPVADRTVCVYVLPDGDWNESANETNVLAKCEKVAVVYESDLEVLRGTYTYETGQTVMVAVHDGLNLETVADKVKDVLGIETLEEKGRMHQSNTGKILYSR